MTHALSQAEKKISVVTSCATDKMTTIFIQNEKHHQYDLLIVLIGWHQNRTNNRVLNAANPEHSADPVSAVT